MLMFLRGALNKHSMVEVLVKAIIFIMCNVSLFIMYNYIISNVIAAGNTYTLYIVMGAVLFAVIVVFGLLGPTAFWIKHNIQKMKLTKGARHF